MKRIEGTGNGTRTASATQLSGSQDTLVSTYAQVLLQVNTKLSILFRYQAFCTFAKNISLEKRARLQQWTLCSMVGTKMGNVSKEVGFHVARGETFNYAHGGRNQVGEGAVLGVRRLSSVPNGVEITCPVSQKHWVVYYNYCTWDSRREAEAPGSSLRRIRTRL